MATTLNSRHSTNVRAQTSFGCWLQWMAASSAGFGLGGAAFGVLSAAYRDEPSSAIVGTITFTLTALIGTTAPGFLHWLILRQRFSHAAWWVPASTAGSVLGFVMLLWGFAVGDTRGGDRGFWPIFYGFVFPILAIAVGGAVAGAMQWLVLRRWIAHAGWWIPVCSISWVAATLTYFTLTRSDDLQNILAAVVSGAVSGAITGLVLVSLLHSTQGKAAVATHRGTHQHRPLFAAWISPVIPVVAATLVWLGATSGPYKREQVAVIICSFVACCIGILAAIISLFGIKRNGALRTLPAATLGLLLNAAVGVIALIMWVLTGLPQSP